MGSEDIGRERSRDLRGPLAASLLLHGGLLALLALGLPRTVPEPAAPLEVRLVSLETEDGGGLGGGEHTAQGSPAGAGAGSPPGPAAARISMGPEGREAPRGRPEARGAPPAPAGAAPMAPPQAPPPAQPPAPLLLSRSGPREPLPVEGMKKPVAELSLPSPARLEAPVGRPLTEEVIPRQGPAPIEDAAPAARLGSVPGSGLAGEEREASAGAEGAFDEPKGGGAGLGGLVAGRGGGAAGAGGPAGGGAFAEILRRIEAAKHYPEQARRLGHRGTVAIRFRVGSDGAVTAVEVVGSSGSPYLDAASLETVRGAAPLPPVQGWLRVRISYGLREGRP